jgi:hypothetical protein
MDEMMRVLTLGPLFFGTSLFSVIPSQKGKMRSEVEESRRKLQ